MLSNEIDIQAIDFKFVFYLQYLASFTMYTVYYK